MLSLALLLLAAPEDPSDFQRDVLPVLEASCVHCHGEAKQKAGLRLDSLDAVLAGSFFGEQPVVVAGSAQESVLYRRLVTDDALERMPADGPRLSPEALEVVRRWIDEGSSGGVSGNAVAKHWAYVPPARPALPAGAARHPIDRFVEARLADAGLAPAPRATRGTQLRRASLDLCGLPPGLDELDRFLADDAPGAWERALGRLLASPHYGEARARRWLDLARYADSMGYEKDERRTMWRYRDWVIDSFNRDLAFDRFTIEQLAGDLLPDPTLEQLVATGFHRNTMTNREGGIDPEEFRAAAVVDRVNTTSEVWLGTTMACVQCHNHKFDPFTQREYYELYAFFDQTEDTGNSEAPTIEAPTAEQLEEREHLRREAAELEATLGAWTDELAAGLFEFEAAWREDGRRWSVWTPAAVSARDGSTLEVLEDGSVLASGELPAKDRYSLVFEASEARTLRELQVEVLLDDSLPIGPGRTSHGNFVLSQLVLGPEGGEPVALQGAIADHSQDDYPVARAVDGKAGTGWAVAGQYGVSHVARFELAQPWTVEPGQRVELALEQAYGSQHLIGRVRISTASEPAPGPRVVPGAEIRPLLELARQERSDEERDRVRAWWRERSPVLESTRARLAELRAKRYPTALVMRERNDRRETRIHVGGSFLNPGDLVKPAVPAVLHELDVDGEIPDRLDLARWLVARDNPLTARVIVNRLWAELFGSGFVTTGNDFGTQSDPPTHPELLDWLAIEFMESGWSVKALLKTVLTSETYRRSARVTPEQLELDPRNRLLARGPRLRLGAEPLRDLALSVSGLLHPAIGGPSVFPPQPDGTWAMTYSGDRWMEASDEDRYRRGLYTFWRRTAPYPAFMIFDAPSRELCTESRPRTNTPLQALATLNDPVWVEASGALARRMMAEGGDAPGARAAYGFRLCTSRVPQDAELDVLIGLFRSERQTFAANPDTAHELAQSSRAFVGGEVDPVELAAWIVVANVLLNLDETVTKG